MANLRCDTTIRNDMMDLIATAAGSGAKILVYGGVQPAGGGAPAGTLLAELSITGAYAAAASSGVLTANAVNSDAAANDTGTATWARVTTSADVWVYDGDVSVTGGSGDFTFDDIDFQVGGTVSMSGPNTLTAPNAA